MVQSQTQCVVGPGSAILGTCVWRAVALQPEKERLQVVDVSEAPKPCTPKTSVSLGSKGQDGAAAVNCGTDDQGLPTKRPLSPATFTPAECRSWLRRVHDRTKALTH